MRAIVKPKPVEGQEWKRGFELIEREQPVVQTPADVLMKVYAGAICGTDVGIYHCKDSIKTSMLAAKTDPITVGHEFCGHIVDAGPAARKELAALVVAKAKTNPKLRRKLKGTTAAALARRKDFIRMLETEFNATAEMHVTCGTCYQCRLGEKHVCRNTVINGLHDNGAFAEYVKVPAENVRLYFGDEVHPDIISFMDALGNATHTVMSAEVKGKSVAVLGCGVQGLMAVAVAKYAGAKRIYVTDASHAAFSHEKLVSKRFAMARRYGADACFDVANEEERLELYKRVRLDTENTGVDAVYEMSGNYRAYNDAAMILRMGGTLSLLGLPSGTMNVDFAKNIIFSGITVHGIIGRRVFQTWDQMETLLRAGLNDLFLSTGFVTHHYKLEEFDKAFDAIQSGDALKILLHP